MTGDSGKFKSPLGRARHLGAAHGGTQHWLRQRVTAIANIPLVIWAVWSITGLVGADYDIACQWLAHPVNAVLMILFICATFYHAVLGAQVITEDYVHHEGLKLAKLIAQKLIYFALAVAGIFAVLSVSL
jgi:succinate dehydrogenase / fumarate reductase membrane anchor subunit